MGSLRFLLDDPADSALGCDRIDAAIGGDANKCCRWTSTGDLLL
jgi:hypothetical protein